VEGASDEAGNEIGKCNRARPERRLFSKMLACFEILYDFWFKESQRQTYFTEVSKSLRNERVNLRIYAMSFPRSVAPPRPRYFQLAYGRDCTQ